MSKITHLFLSLPNPGKHFITDLMLLFYDFIWNGKKDKIKRKTLCKPLEEGGLNMIDVNVFIESLKLKVTWIRKLLKNRQMWVDHFTQEGCARPRSTEVL